MARKANITKLATALTVPEWTRRLPGTGAPLDVAGRIMRDLSALDDEAEGRIVEAGKNPDLSPSGRTKAVAVAGEAELVNLDELRRETERHITGAVVKARAEKTEPTPEAVMRTINRATETRRYLVESLGEDSLKLEGVIRDAESAGDTETIDAILDGPPAWPLYGAFDREAVTAKRNGMTDANLGPDVVTLVNAERDLKDRIGWVEAHIRDTAGISLEGDQIEEIANAAVGTGT
jgi:hypothetical protein